jgi:acetyl esterase/lipase
MMERAIRWTLAVLLVTWAGAAPAQTPGAAPTAPAQKAAKEIPLYPGAAPGSEKWDWSERAVTNARGLPMVQDVVRPVLLYYPADREKAVGAAMIVAPGGGFRTLMMSYEGVDIAWRLNAMGVDAFVLKYRLAHDGPGAPRVPDVVKLAADDGRQAVRLVREKADAFGYRPDRVGMIGFSAGGMVTSEALFGPAQTRPNFAALIYGAPREVKEMPNPALPLFLAVAADDALAVERTIELFRAYRKAKGPAELHVFQMGAHGFVNKGGGADHFMDRLEEWLAANKLLPNAAARTAPPGVTAPPAVADEKDKQDLAGTWTLKYDPGNGETYEPELTVTKEGAGYKVVFTDRGQKLTAKDVRLKNGKLSFKIDTEHEGAKASVTFEAKVKGDAIEGEGKWEFQDMSGDFPFTGKRKDAKPGK